MKTLILGGVKSGKSRLAARLAAESGRPVVVVATARPGDESMRARIEAHRRERPAHWRVVEEPRRLGEVLRREAGNTLLVDCLTLWLSNLLVDDTQAAARQGHGTDGLESERAALLAAMEACRDDLILVSNETNMGVHPVGELGLRFCDEAGGLHQALAARCDRVVLAIAGLAHVLKPPPTAEAGFLS